MPSKLKRVIRLDSQPLSQTFFTSEGYLMDRPILTSTGIFEYVNPDGSIRRELRLPEEVFDTESLKSYRGKPIIVTHDAGLITKDNVAENAIGTILSEGYRSGNDVRAEIVIHKVDELKDCGYRELSLGYNLDLDETPGFYEGEPYDAIQKNIRINHLALVDEARAGDQARLNIDSCETVLKGGKLMKKTTKKKSVRRVDSKKHRNDGILSPDELKKAVAEYKARREERLAAKADEDDTTAAEKMTAAVVPTTETNEDKDEDVVVVLTDNPDEFEAQIEEQLQMVKDRRDRRDAAGDPETLPEAEGIIANQDKDLSTLFDIIDTLLAQIAFDGDSDDEECCEDEPSETNEDEETENSNEPADEESVNDENAETAENEDDADNDDDDVPSAEVPATINADSIDRIVRERVKIAKAASALNMDGLESIKPMKAKKTIIKAVKPGVRLDGRSNAYINAMFDLVCQDIQKYSRKDTAYQRAQMFNNDSSRSRQNSNTTEVARQKMIRRMQKSK